MANLQDNGHEGGRKRGSGKVGNGSRVGKSGSDRMSIPARPPKIIALGPTRSAHPLGPAEHLAFEKRRGALGRKGAAQVRFLHF